MGALIRLKDTVTDAPESFAADPRAIEWEQTLLTCLLQHPETIALVSTTLAGTDFSVAYHQKIYLTILGMAERGEPTGVLEVCRQLADHGEIEDAGGKRYIWALYNGFAISASAQYYASKIVERSVTEKSSRVAAHLQSQIESGRAPSEVIPETVQRLSELKSRLDDADDGSIVGALGRLRADIQERIANPGALRGLSTGFADVDRLTNGLRPGSLTVLGARPSMGKTLLASNFAQNVLKQPNASVAFFSLEMSAEQILERMVVRLAADDRLVTADMMDGRLGVQAQQEIEKAFAELSKTSLTIFDRNVTELAQVLAKLRKMAHSGAKPSLVVIDHLSLMQDPLKDDDGEPNRQFELARVSRELKLVAVELNIPIVLLAQLNRNVEGRKEKRPMLSDLRDSGGIEENADLVMFLHRQEYYEPEEDEHKGKAELIIAKNRNGKIGIAKLFFDPSAMSFREVTVSKEGDKEVWYPVRTLKEKPQFANNSAPTHDWIEKEDPEFPSTPTENTDMKAWTEDECRQLLEKAQQVGEVDLLWERMTAVIADQDTPEGIAWAAANHDTMARVYEEMKKPKAPDLFGALQT